MESTNSTDFYISFQFPTQNQVYDEDTARVSGWSRSTVAIVVLTANQGQSEAADPAGGQLGGERPRARD